ncbi:hypothetical protein ABL78_2240 [Leptomonas seymouri]|uniref:Uncharacterized protein n=1 Tax=Leptomonas seymouri TaxID=5684 RepID=A0A0N0P7C2_LEPSE|nr:hypothetical protein ABL78_2240 [Leptomonas seymouri]|eukprot:KPI88636.1 hypothetical protein ABL78_2240 [Leptomonas seymouri]
MQSDFTNVEAELRDIESAFAVGRMNAFGSASTQDAFVHELKRIAEIETQVFYRTCALLKSSSTNEHTLVTNMYASAQPPPQSQWTATSNSNFGDNSFRGSSATLDSSMLHRSGASASTAPRNNSHTSAPASAMNGGRSGVSTPGATRQQSHNGRDGAAGASPNTFGVTNESLHGPTPTAPHIRQSEWGNEDGFSDKAFEDVAAHFDELESQFSSLGDYLREISKHVMRLNDMSEQVNSGAGGSGLLNPGSSNLGGYHLSTVPSSNGGWRRVRGDSDEDGGVRCPGAAPTP